MPFEASVIARYPAKAAWDAEAADLVGAMLQRWQLTPGEAYVGGEAAAVLRVHTADGRPAVLKVGFPHFEAVWEAVGLTTWGPALAPRVLRQDPWTWSLLLEQLEPGIPLSSAALPVDDALRTAWALYGELVAAAPPPGVLTLREMIDEYLRNEDARAAVSAPVYEELGASDLLARGLAMARELADTDTGSAFLHGDFNPGNVLSTADGWRVIDPKPMAGDPEFDLFPLIEQLGQPFRSAAPVTVLRERVARAAEVTGLDPVRTTRWCFARCALDLAWLVEDGERAAAADTLRELRIWEAVLS